MAAFKALEVDYAPETQKSTIQSLMWDKHCAWLRTMVCLQIANVEPNDRDRDQRKHEMWIINSPTHEPVGIYCTPTEWDEVKKSFEQVKECGWTTFLAQRAQVRHARRHLQIVEQTTPDHLKNSDRHEPVLTVVAFV